MDGPTDGRTDGRTDKAGCRVACTRLKIKNNVFTYYLFIIVVKLTPLVRELPFHNWHEVHQFWYAKDFLIAQNCKYDFPRDGFGFLLLTKETSDAGSQYRCGWVGRGIQPLSTP